MHLSSTFRRIGIGRAIVVIQGGGTGVGVTHWCKFVTQKLMKGMGSNSTHLFESIIDNCYNMDFDTIMALFEFKKLHYQGSCFTFKH
jgi:hypothetical protein